MSDDLIKDLRSEHPSDVGRWLRANRAADEIESLREALKFARKRIEYYGTMVARRHFDHDLAEVYPRIDAALNQQEEQ